MFKDIDVEKAFVYLALIFGFIFILIIPPFQSPDEDSHFKRAYVISNGDIFPTKINNEIGYYLPDQMFNYISEKLTYMGKFDKKYSYKDIYFDEKMGVDYSNKTFRSFSTVNVNPVVYTAPSLGIFVGKMFSSMAGINGDVSATYMLYFARIFSLILYIVLTYFAIKTTPILKKTFCAIALLPMSLSLAASVSYDNVLIPLSLMLTAMIFKLSYDDKIKVIDKKYVIAIIIIGFILLTVKTVYVTILALLLFIPQKKWINRKNMIKQFAIICVSILLLSLIFKIPYLLLGNSTSIGKSLSSQQLSFIIHNPIDYIFVLLRSFKSLFYFYLSGIIGTFGLLDTNMLVPFIIFYAFCFALIGISDVSLCGKKISFRNKIVVTIAILISVFGIFTALYIFWTSGLEGLGIGSNIVSGVQGRYFIPLLPIAFLIFGNQIVMKNKHLSNIAESLLSNSYLLILVMLTLSSLTIIFRYWY